MKVKYIKPELTKVYIDTKDVMTQSNVRIVTVNDSANYDQAPTYEISSGFWIE